MRRVYLLGAVLSGVLSVTVAGCSSGTNKITGAVHFNGQPLADARVEFHPRDNLNMAVADVRTDREGKFEVRPRPRSKEVLPPGQYVVFVRKLVDQKGNVPNDEEYGQLEAAGQLSNQVPDSYSDRFFPQITVDIKPDTRSLDPFELKGQ